MSMTSCAVPEDEARFPAPIHFQEHWNVNPILSVRRLKNVRHIEDYFK
jgi:hypothetical protein